jgi:uncharacterized protein DUF3455
VYPHRSRRSPPRQPRKSAAEIAVALPIRSTPEPQVRLQQDPLIGLRHRPAHHRVPGRRGPARLHLLNHAVPQRRSRIAGIGGAQQPDLRLPPQPDGSFALTQHDVEAHLADGIQHTFVQPAAAPPQRQAPDGSMVTGEVVTKNDNGAGNIAELNLDAIQIGASTGLPAHVVEVLRLNTHGGVAPAGPCDPQATPIVNIPYQANYVSING